MEAALSNVLLVEFFSQRRLSHTFMCLLVTLVLFGRETSVDQYWSKVCGIMVFDILKLNK